MNFFQNIPLPSFLCLLLLLGFSHAQDTCHTHAILPQAGQRGTTVEVFANGAFLQDAQEVLFYQPGIKCVGFQEMTEAPGTRLLNSDRPRKDIPPGQLLKLIFKISPNAPLGEHQFRIRTRDGFGELMTYWVTPFPVIEETHPFTDENDTRNDKPEFAQPIPLNSTVIGWMPLPLPQDHDFYRVECRKGQRLTVEAIGQELGTLHYGGLNDPALKIYDSKGHEIARNDDNSLFGADPYISIIIPEDGSYFIDMHQQMDYENRRRHYMLHVGTWKRPALTYPLGGQAGQTTAFQLLGLNESQMVTLQSDPGSYESAHQAIWTKGSPTPNYIHVSPFPEHDESDGDRITKSLPLNINGRITTEGEVDWYRFSAKKGERYRVRTYSKTLGSELDARIWIKPAAGNGKTWDVDDSGWEAHDLVGHSYRHQIPDRLDPIFMFEPDRDGEYLIGIADTRRDFGPHHVYRVEFQPHMDGTLVHFDKYPSNAPQIRDRLTVFRGHGISRPVSIQNGFGSKYQGRLQLRAANLPTGVTLEAPTFTANESKIPLYVHASASTKPGAHALDLIVEPVDPAHRSAFRGGYIQNVTSTQRRGAYDMKFNRTRKAALAVVEDAPFNISIQQPKVALVQNGELALHLNVVRHPGFSDAIYCEMDWLPNGVNKQPPLIIPANQTTAEYRVNAAGNATPGKYRVSITARENQVAGGSVRSAAGYHFVSSRFVDLEISEPFVTVKLTRAAIERGKTGQMIANIEHHKPFEREASLTLGRLPFGVRQVGTTPKIKPGEKKATFQVEVTSDCLIGQYKDIYCEVTIAAAGQQIRQQSGNGVLRVDPERK